MTAPWITFRPELKILDCTIRDGGLVNEHMLDDDVVKAVYDTCIEAGVDYMEIGYKNSKKLFAPGKFGAWKHCDEDDMRRVIGDNDSSLKKPKCNKTLFSIIETIVFDSKSITIKDNCLKCSISLQRVGHRMLLKIQDLI